MTRGPITLDATLDPWERQPGETARQFGRLTVYLDLGRVRTLKMCVRALNSKGDTVAHRTLQQIAWERRWTERAEAYDLDQDNTQRQQLITDRRDMVERHRKVAGALLSTAISALKQIPTHLLDAGDVVRLVKLATDLERTTLALPKEHVAVTGPTGGPVQTEDLTNLSGEERRARLAEIAAELARRAGTASDDDDD
jgi:hypothetical protein